MQQPKHNPEAELGVIGTLITLGDHQSIVVQEAFLRLREDFFYRPAHKELFNIIKKCYENKHWFDISSMMDSTRGSSSLQDYLAESVMGNFFTHSRMSSEITQLEHLWELREQQQVLMNAIVSSYREPVTNIACDLLFTGLQKAGNIKVSKMEDGADYADIADSYLKGEFKNNAVVETGIAQFGDIFNSSLVVIAGDSGVGKTFFGIYLMHQIAIHQREKQSLFFSLEMTRNDIWERHIAIIANKSFDELSKEELSAAIAASLERKTRVYDQPRIDIEYIETVCHLQAMKKPLSVVVVDYLGLITSCKKYDREDIKISDITQRLTALSIKLNCIVICLTQVNRDPSKRNQNDRCPYPTDVADSVGSVRSSSLWIGIDRPELYQDDLVNKNLFVAKCRKNRRGDNFEAYFDFNKGRFVERMKPQWKIEESVSILDRLKKKGNYLGDY